MLFTFIGIFLYVLLFTKYGFFDAIKYAHRDDFLGGLIAIGAAANFIPFFVFLKKDSIYKARGVLISTIIAAVIILLLKIGVI